MSQYSTNYKSDNLEEIINKQIHDLKPILIDYISKTKNGRTIDYTHTIDISFEERRHQIIKQMAILKNARYFKPKDYRRMEKILFHILIPPCKKGGSVT